MCGIAGFFTSSTDSYVEGVLHSMLDSIEHRGPDSRGTFVSPSISLPSSNLSYNLAFGMNRLSIIDLSSGNQPIFNEDKNLVIVFNGEIYNYKELRSFLLKRGHVFSTNSDTEVILHLYEELGEEAFSLLRGMFAFTIWDKRKNELIIVRDHFGIKPLFYFHNQSTFAFGSEIKCLFSVPDFKKDLEKKALLSHFTLLFTSQSTTLFKGVKKIPPGHFLKLSISNDKLDTVLKKYYSLKIPPPILKNRNDRKEYIRELLKDSVKMHLVSDVPIGLMLSGGVDSSLLLALMNEELGGGISTYSVGYEEGGGYFDERRYAREVANHLGSVHSEKILSASFFKSSFLELLNTLDEPFANASVFANYFLSKHISEDVKVVLSGLGGDEVSGGYERYRGMYLSQKLMFDKMIPLMKLLSKGSSYLPDSSRGYPLSERLKRFFSHASKAPSLRYFSFLSKFHESEIEQIFSKKILEEIRDSSECPKKWCVDLFEQSIIEQNGLNQVVLSSCYVDIHTYMLEDLLALSDRCSMAASLEMRVPFVDRFLIEGFFSLPDSDRMSMTETKVLLKEIASEYLPREIVYRRKQGFSVPLSVWFRDIMKPFILEHLSAQSLSDVGVFNPKYVERIMIEHLAGKRNFDEKIFSILSFNLWCKHNQIRV